MGKKDDLISELRPILTDRKKLEDFLLASSNLPGPRANLELLFALAEIYDNVDTLTEWSQITEAQADTNNPRAFLVFCAAVCLGKVYARTKTPKAIPILKKLANDGRWRTREAVAFGFQLIGEHDFEELRTIFSEWIKTSNNLEKRAILASLAHPPFLNEISANFCLEITDRILQQLDKGINFDVLEKGLKYTISVFAAAAPKQGFSFIEKWIGKDPTIDKIMKENLKKNRLLKVDPDKVKFLLLKLNPPALTLP